MSYEWDDKLTEKFLTLYRKHQCLWNPYSPNYRNCSVKNEAFRSVIQELNIPKIRISECLQQIEVIREKYKREQLKAEKELKAGNLYTSKLPWFNLMSRMLCEVINDEENFSEVPVKIIPCTITKGEQSKDSRTAVTYEEYIESKSKWNNSDNHTEWKCPNLDLQKLTELPLRNDNLQYKPNVVNAANDPWNKCPSCGWKTEKNQETTYNRESQFGNYKESSAQINIETEVPLQIKQTRILEPNNNICKENQLIPPPLCVDEMNHLNLKTNTPETNMLQNKEKMHTHTGIASTRDSRELYVPMLLKKCNGTKDKVAHQDYNKAKDSLDFMSSKENTVHHPQSRNQLEKNVIICPSHVSDVHQNQFLEDQLRNFEIYQTNHCVGGSSPSFVPYQDTFIRQSTYEDDTENKRNLCVKRYNSRIKKFEERGSKLNTTSEEDKYEVCSRFKIVIPCSDQEDQNLEIIGYEVCAIKPQLSRYMLCPSSEIPKAVIGDVECACKNEFSAANRNMTADSTRYRNIIKLDICHKRSKEIGAEKQLEDAEIDDQHKSISNKKMQTDSSYENKSTETSRDTKMSRFNFSKSTRDQGCAIDISSMNATSGQATTLVQNHNSILQHQSSLMDNSVPSQNTPAPSETKNDSLPVDKFNNTRIFLNVIVKILESDDTHDVSQDLQKTLNTMLDRLEQTPMVEQRPIEHYADNNIVDAMFDDTMSTQYHGLAPNPAHMKQQTENMDLQNSRPGVVHLEDTNRNLRPQSLILEETSHTVNEPLGGRRRRSWPLNETTKSGNEGSTQHEQPVSLLNDTDTSVGSALDYSSVFPNERPIASSSRRFTEHRTPSQLTKDFLDVIKYTMMMDGALQPENNSDRNCCRSTRGQ